MVEDENHFLHDCECDLYNDLRLKLISNLNKSPLINDTDNTDSHLQLNVNNSSLKYNLMSLLSPYTDTNITENNTNMINHHHKAILSKHIRQNMGTVNPNHPSKDTLLYLTVSAPSCTALSKNAKNP